MFSCLVVLFWVGALMCGVVCVVFSLGFVVFGLTLWLDDGFLL